MKQKFVVLLVTIALLQCGTRTLTKTKGLVEVSSIYGFVTDETLVPISDAKVLIAGDNEYTAYTNDAGYFILDDLVPDTYKIIITKIGYKAQKFSAKVKKRKSEEFNVVLKQVEKGMGQIHGTVVDYMSSEPLVVKAFVTELGMTTVSDASGHFTFEGLKPRTYLLKFEALHYVTAHNDIAVQPDEVAEIVLTMIRAGTVITLEGIEFEFGKAIIKPESSPVLDEAAAILTNHPEIEVEVQGHTDSIGTAQANRILSQKRAEAVREYLIDIHMIEPVRLIPIGYGESKPVADNATDAGRAKNRRVDFVVLSEPR